MVVEEDAMTRRLLEAAGIRPGMRVLDVGCGLGKVAALVADLVGDAGQVVGLDRDAGVLAMARARAAELGLDRVSFVEGDLDGALDLEPFDAAVGRRVLMYLPDPVGALRRLAAIVRPGGPIAFHELDSTMIPASRVALPLHERAHGWIWKTLEREGANLHMGFDLASVFAEAGLVVGGVHAEARVQSPATRSEIGPVLRYLIPRLERQGVATAAELDVDTIDERLDEERRQANATYVGEVMFGGWARSPTT